MRVFDINESDENVDSISSDSKGGAQRADHSVNTNVERERERETERKYRNKNKR